jgi:hypothetical protein
MILREFSSTPTQSIKKLNQRLNEQYGITVKQKTYTRARLEHLHESALKNVQRLKEQNHKFQLDPEYAKYLGVKDITDIMLREGMYEGGRAYVEADDFIRGTMQELCDMGYDDDEAKLETLNRCRMRPDALSDSVYEEIAERCISEMGVGGVALEEEYGDDLQAQVAEIARRYPEDFQSFLAGDDGGMFYEEVFELFSNSGEMPYGTQKARDGDPEEWIAQRLHDLGFYGTDEGETPLEEDSASLPTEMISDFITNEIGNGAGVENIDDHGETAVISVYAPNEESEVFGETFKNYLWELCEPLGCVDVQGPSFVNNEPGYVLADWTLYKDSEEMYEGFGAAMKRSETKRQAAIKRAKKDMKNGMSAAEAGKKHDLLPKDIENLSNAQLDESVNVDEAEVVMALRAQSNVLADQIEKIGRMLNEDLIKIVEQIGHEMGQETAGQVKAAVSSLLNQHMDSARVAKDAMDDVVREVAAGHAPNEVSPDLDSEEPEGDMPDMDLDLDDEESNDETGGDEMSDDDINEPAMSGPKDNPMGRAEI